MNRIVVSLSRILIDRGKTVAVAESCTGGLLANLLTNIPGSSRYFLLGIIPYNSRLKASLLKIPALLIKRYGAVSMQVSKLMAQNVKRIASADCGIGITGIAGPLGNTPTKPIGTVFISVATKRKVISRRFHFLGNRLEIKRKAVLKAIAMLKESLLKKEIN